jgi:hypothetical protein
VVTKHFSLLSWPFLYGFLFQKITEDIYGDAIHIVGSSTADVSIYRDKKVATTIEKVFEFIQEANHKFSQTADPWKIKHVINAYLYYYDVPTSTIQFLINTCPIVSSLHAIFLFYVDSSF